MHKQAFLLLLATLLPSHGFALGLGSIEVNSNLNEKLDTRILLLSGTSQDTEMLIVKLASREEFKKAGVDRPHLLTDLKFGTVVDGDNVYITVKTTKTIREPSMSFLLDVDWPNGHMLREYTILLMPPSMVGRPAP